MDGFFEKFSIYDFFNLIAAGIIFLIGLLSLGLLELTTLAESLGTTSETKWIFYVVIIGGCYLIGSFFQQFGSITFEKRYSSTITSTILCNQFSVLNNHLKLEVHQEYARRLFEEKGIPFSGNCFSKWYCEYYFAYCSYYIQNQNKHQKAEKMRGLRGIYSLFVTCFAWLLAISLARIVFAMVNSDAFAGYIGIAVVCFVLLCIYIHAYKENTQYWARMVLGVYEACIDIDMHDVKKA